MLISETSFALRRLRAAPGVSAFAALSLALGISMTTATFAATSSLVWRPLQVRDPDRVALLTASVPVGQPTWRGGVVSALDFDDLAASQTSFRHLAATASHTEVLSTNGIAVVAQIEAVTGSYFETVGATPVLGSLLPSIDGRARETAAVVLSEHFWVTHFRRDPRILGGTVRIAGSPFEIVGVVSHPYAGVGSRLMMRTDAWVPLSLGSRVFTRKLEDPNVASRTVLGLLTPGRSLAQTEVEFDIIAKRLDTIRPLHRTLSNGSQVTVSREWSVRTAADVNAELTDILVPLRWSLIVLAGLVLTIACTNLANLMLARGSARRHEFALRRALGASRPRLMAGQLIESGLMLAAGGLGAVALTRLFISMLAIDVPIGGNVIIHLQPRLDGAVLGLTVLAMAACLVVFGWWPALRSTRTDLRAALTAETQTITPRWRARRGLIAAQVGVSAALFVLAALGAHALREQADHDSGVDIERLAIGFLNLDRPPWNESLAHSAIETILMEARRQPAIQAASISTGLAFGVPSTPSGIVSAARHANLDSTGDKPVYVIAATPDIFQALGVRIIQGRGFDQHPRSTGQPIALVSESTATALFGSANVIGQEVVLQRRSRITGTTSRTVVTLIGVTEDTDTTAIFSREMGVIYLSLAQYFEPRLTIVARAVNDPEPVVGILRQIVSRADPNLALEPRAGTGTEILAGPYHLVDILASLAAALAVTATALSMAGLYGLLNNLVTTRTRELGIRMSLGADGPAIRRLVLSGGLRPVLWGLGFGVGLGILARIAIGILYDFPISVSETMTVLVVPTTLIAVTLGACYPPAWRATRVDPKEVLRDA